MNIRAFLLTVGALWAIFLIGPARTFAVATQAQAAPSAIDLDTQRLRIAQIDANWRFHPGDNPRWSTRDLDDSGWKLFQPRTSWPSQGYASNQELGWFRFRLLLPASMTSAVLQLPAIDRNFQVFADGKLIGQVGLLPPEKPTALISTARVFTLPVPPGPGPHVVQIAIRLWQARELAGVRADVLRGRVYAGDAATQLRLFSTIKAAVLLSHGSEYTQDVIMVIVGAASLLLFLLTHQNYYLWFAASMAVSAAQFPVSQASMHFSWTFLNLLYANILLDMLSLITFGFFLLGALNERGWRIRLLIFVLTFLGELGPLLVLLVKLPLVWADTAYFLFVTAAEFLVIGFLVQGWRRGSVDAKLLLFPYLISVLVGSLDNLGHVLIDFNVPHGEVILTRFINVLSDPFVVSVDDVGSIASLVGLLTVLVFRFAQTSREQQRLAAALQAAHDIQHRLVPVDIPSLGGLHTEIVYLAAEEVGGDFCQILRRPDHSILIAIGDVSGKGLQAAMLSSVAVGAIRAMADDDIEPAHLLSKLNHVLLRTESTGFVTCLCMLLNDSGEVTIANAGHLSPYLDGQEVLLPPGLPLGITSDTAYEQCAFVLSHSARLTLLSDGVVEARSKDGELFGFDRTSLASQLPAAQIAAQAHAHGQEDDITIITLDWRAPVREMAMA